VWGRHGKCSDQVARNTWVNSRRGDPVVAGDGYRVEFVDSTCTVLNVILTEAALLELAGASCELAEEVDGRRAHVQWPSRNPGNDQGEMGA